jgi:hypothetical protein
MIRLPDRAFTLLERVYKAQNRLRTAERRLALKAEDARQRAYYADLSDRHDMGTCGGKEAGCCYVPCVPFVGFRTING